VLSIKSFGLRAASVSSDFLNLIEGVALQHFLTRNPCSGDHHRVRVFVKNDCLNLPSIHEARANSS